MPPSQIRLCIRLPAAQASNAGIPHLWDERRPEKRWNPSAESLRPCFPLALRREHTRRTLLNHYERVPSSRRNEAVGGFRWDPTGPVLRRFSLQLCRGLASWRHSMMHPGTNSSFLIHTIAPVLKVDDVHTRP